VEFFPVASREISLGVFWAGHKFQALFRLA